MCRKSFNLCLVHFSLCKTNDASKDSALFCSKKVKAQRKREREKKERQTDRQRDRDRQTDRQTDRQRSSLSQKRFSTLKCFCVKRLKEKRDYAKPPSTPYLLSIKHVIRKDCFLFSLLLFLLPPLPHQLPIPTPPPHFLPLNPLFIDAFTCVI